LPSESVNKGYTASTNLKYRFYRQRVRSSAQLKYYSPVGIYTRKELSLGILDWSSNL